MISDPRTGPAARLTGAASVGAACAMIGEAVAEARGSALQAPLGAGFNLLLVPLALWLLVTLRPRGRAAAAAGTAAGLGSLLLWAGAFVFGWFQLEVVWITLSAAWWLVLAYLLSRGPRALAILTAVTGLAAALDATVTGIEMVRPLTFAQFALVGAWKLPLQLLWTVVLGLLLLVRGRL